MKEIKEIVAQNLAELRTKNGYTQGELAEMVNYTDKSVSKWEHGEAMPPIDVLKKLADIYNVTLDYLVTDTPSDQYDKIYNNKQNTPNKIIITLLAVSLVWIVATIMFFYGSIFAQKNLWLLFVFSIPISTIVLLVFNGIWGRRIFTFILISILTWTTLLSIYLTFLRYNIWTLFIVGIPFQIATILWSQLRKNKK